jgi:hypothetical protein
LSERWQIDAVSVTPCDHRKARKTAFGRLCLQNQWRSASNDRRGPQYAVRKIHAIFPGLERMRGAADVV